MAKKIGLSSRNPPSSGANFRRNKKKEQDRGDDRAEREVSTLDPNLTSRKLNIKLVQTSVQGVEPGPGESEENFSASKKNALQASSDEVSLSQVEDSNNAVNNGSVSENNSGVKKMPVTLVKQPKQPGKSNAVVYNMEGRRGTIRFSKKFFSDAAGPDSITLEDIDGLVAAGGAPKAAKEAKEKLSPEARAEQLKVAREARKAMTPEQRIAAEEERLQKQQARIAKLKAAVAAPVESEPVTA